jgi:peroxiredoxin
VTKKEWEMKTSKKLLAAGLVGVISCCLVGTATAQDTAMKLVAIGDEAPDFELSVFSPDESVDERVSLRQFRGKKVVMMEFWATWCDICVAEMPRLQKEYEEYKDKGYEILAITLSRGGEKDKKKIQTLKDRNKLTYPLLMDTEFEVATKIYGLSGPIPLKAIIDCQGNLRYTHVGDYADGISEVPFVLDELLADPACNP